MGFPWERPYDKEAPNRISYSDMEGRINFRRITEAPSSLEECFGPAININMGIDSPVSRRRAFPCLLPQRDGRLCGNSYSSPYKTRNVFAPAHCGIVQHHDT